MKIIKKTFFLLITFLVLSCNNEDITKINAIELEVEIIEQLVGSDFVFNVKADTDQDITELVTIKVEDAAIQSNIYNANLAGMYDVIAYYDGLQSNKITIRVIQPALNDYTQKVLIEDYTGTWCGFCPGVAYAIEQAKLESDKVVSVAMHIRQDDPYQFEGSTSLSEIFEIGGLPEGRINRTIFWNSPQHQNLSQALDLTGLTASLGLAINSTVTNNVINATVKIGFKTEATSNLTVVVYLLENDLIHDQTNNTNFFPVGQYVNPLVDFVHNEVLRAVFTDNLGNDIPESQTTAETIYETTINGNIPNTVENLNNLHLVAFVVDKATRTVINVQEATVGENKDFD